MNKFTSSQLDAINTRGSNILVSAGAGSGKTTVLTNRVAEYVTSGGDIRRLLIITFTNLAARNMKDKIKEKLALLNEGKDLRRIDSSFIGTFDSYTFSIVKKYHYALGLSKNINITDYSFVLKKKREFVDEIFDKHYISKDASFLELVRNTCVKSDQGLRDTVINIDNSFSNLVKRTEKCHNYIDTTFSSENIDKNLGSFVEMLKVKLIPVEKALFTLNGTLNYEKNILMLQREIADFQSIQTYDDLYSFVNTTYISRLMKESSDAKEANNNLKDMIKELKGMAKYEKLSDFKDEILKTRETNKVIMALVEELNSKILKYKADNNIFTFNDISILAIKILTDFPEIRAEIKNSYDEILIDEYQDTSDIEETLISLIAQNNVYMVGDIKQSIYRFRNANPDIFKEKYDRYLHTSAGVLINLQDNFRSRPEVIMDINNIFCDLMHSNTGGADYKEHHQMTYGNKSYDTCKMSDYDYHMDIYNYYDLYEQLKQRYKKGEIEAQIIAKDISEKMSSRFQVKGHNGQRLAKYSDFCIIMDRTVDYEIYKKIFSSLGIPLSVSEGQKIRNCEEIVPFIRLLELINAIHNHDITSRQFSYKFTSVARSYICSYSDEKIFDLIKNKTIISDPIYQMAENIANDADDLLLSEVTKRVIDDFKIYDKFIKIGSVNKSLAVFNFLLSFSNTFDQLKYDISDYIDFLNDAMTGDLKLEFALDDNSGGVRLIDIHKSKGLEFKVCYFAGIDKR
ncbi:MAG: UvrD-helicase domain-containing protein, partial [Bacilli bacterium]